jgi:hypothetical protein
MNRHLKKEWLEPFRQDAELEALDYEVFFEPRFPRRTALNRLTRLFPFGTVSKLTTSVYTDGSDRVTFGPNSAMSP